MEIAKGKRVKNNLYKMDVMLVKQEEEEGNKEGDVVCVLIGNDAPQMWEVWHR